MGTKRRSQIIFLNGTSSSGKSSIAAELLRILDRPYFHLEVDSFNAMRAKERTRQLPTGEVAALLRRTRAGFHRAVAGMADAGNDIVVARRIAAYVDSPPEERAFERLRRMRTEGPTD